MVKSKDVASTQDNASAAMGRAFTDEMLSTIDSFGAAVALARDAYGDLPTADTELGNGFAILPTDAKGTLVGVSLVLLEWTFHEGDNGEFVSIVAVATHTDGTIRKVVINDGSTGIKDQLAAYQKKTGRTGGLIVKRGLRRSDYTYVDDKGKEKNATTFYLDTSA